MSEWPPAIELRQRLVEISDEAIRLIDNHALAPILDDLLDWINENSDAAAGFDAVFVELIDQAMDEPGGGVRLDPEIFEYCMHTLRYPGVRARLEQMRDTADDTPRGYNTKHWAEGVLAAYSDSWEDIKIGLWPPPRQAS